MIDLNCNEYRFEHSMKGCWCKGPTFYMRILNFGWIGFHPSKEMEIPGWIMRQAILGSKEDLKK